MLRSFLLATAILLGSGLFAQSSSERAAVRITATVQTTPSITLSWASISSTTSITIYRKLKSATSWGAAVATPAASALSWTDTGVSVGTNYEYKIVRVSGGVTGTGYINTGIQVPVVDSRGKMILLVDNTLSSSLSTEITQLINDLRADGWGVLRSDVSRTASVNSVKSVVQGHYNSDPANVKALYILGHVPVPYSGNITPDGHDDGRGARPTDAYYADMDGSWTDNSVNVTVSSTQRTWNTPGDGKFDQSDLPSPVELQVARVDMFDMPAFGTTEVQLMRNYLTKAHNYKVKGWAPTTRAVLVDNLQWLGNPVAGSGWRASQLAGQASPQPAAPVLSFKNYINNQSYLWTAHYGGGLQALDGTVVTYNGTDGGVTTQELATTVTHGGVFNMALGSFFYDFDSRNNFLRAIIARGDGLTNCWAGIPAWYFHHMGLGENIGYSVAATMNNTGLYAPLTEGWQSTIGRTHLNLMGDPSLRMKMVAPPSNLVVTNSGGNAAFSWTASTESVVGYHIYSVDASTGAIIRLTTNAVTGTNWTSGSVPFVAGRQYMVRAVVLETSASGSYYNMSLGAMAVSAGTAAPDCLGLIGGTTTAGSPCNDNNACTINDVYNASCQCVGTSITPAATITASGATTFCTGGSVVLSANTGTGYTYVWKRNGTTISGATSSSYTANQAGSYMVTVTYNGCASSSATTTVTLTSAPTATLTAAGSTTFCAGGSVVLNANTGTGYTYSWRLNGNPISGATTSSYTATQAGSYIVVVSIGSCATASTATTVTVSGGTVPTITTSGSTSFCTGGSVGLSTAAATGNAYQWKLNGTNISGATSNSYTATQTGSYTVAVTNGTCTSTSAAVSVNTSAGTTPTITAQGPTSFCTGGNVILTTTQATGNTYQWRLDGTPLSGATSYAYTAWQNGAMTVTVTNGSCSATSAAVNIAVGTAPSATISAGGPTTFCNGGSVVLSGNTGTGFTYSWSRNGTVISGATSSSYTATLAGSYTRTVNNSGCTATSSAINVTVGAGTVPTITTSGSTSFCTGGSVGLSTAAATGNTYQWKLNGTNISGATSSSYTATQAGSYTVAVTNGTCTSTSAAVSVNTSAGTTPTITAQGPTSFCTGGNVILTTTQATGNTYQWRLNGTPLSGATSYAYTAWQNGAMTVTVTNGSCSATSAAVNIAIGTAPSATISAGGPTTFCNGGSVVLSGNTGTGFTYSWSRNGAVISGATSSSYTATLAGSYTRTVNNSGCTATSSAINVTVGAGTVPTITTSGSTSFCTGGSVGLSTAAATGNTYQWKLNGTNISGATSSSYTATQAGSYTVAVTNGTCTSTSAAVTVNTSAGTTPTITAQGPTSFCTGGNVILTTTQATGNTYQWRLNGTPLSGATSYAYTAWQNGAMTVTVTNGACSATSAAVNIAIGTAPSATISAGGPTTFCNGGSVVLSGNTGTGFTYSWSRNGTVISGATSSSYTATLAGSYTRTVNNSGCTATSSAINVTVGAGAVPTVTAGGPTSFCNGGSVLLSTATATGNTYQWRINGAAISGATGSSYTATQSGSFSVTVTNGTCSATSTAVSVSANGGTAPTITAQGPTSFCVGGNVILTTAQAAGNTYQWRLNGTAISGATSYAYTAFQTGAMTVTVTNGSCTTTSPAVNITVNTAPNAIVTAAGATTFCSGGSVTLNANTGSGLSYGWFRNGTAITGATGSSYLATLPGSYTVTVTQNGCSKSSSAVTVTVNSAPAVTCSSNAAAATVSASASGGLAPYTYSWNTSPSSSSATATVSASGSYTVVVTDARGCTSSCTTTITLPTANPCAGIRTETQTTWGASPSGSNPAAYMVNNFSQAFAAPDYLTIGCGTGSLRLTSGAAVTAFLPSTGTVARLPLGTMVNPTTYANTFAGELVALKLSVRFDEISSSFSPATVQLKNMLITSGLFAGWTVQQLITEADNKIGGCGSSYTRVDLNAAIAAINAGYAGGTINSGYLTCPPGSGMVLEPTIPVTEVEIEAMDEVPTMSVAVFPNPTNGLTTFAFTPTAKDQVGLIEIRSISGALVEQRSLGVLQAGIPQRFIWNAEGNKAGLYMYRIIVGGSEQVVATGKVVVE